MTAYREGTVHLQLRRDHVAGKLKATRATQGHPEHVEPGCIVVKLRLRVDADAWRPLEPDTIHVPAADLAAPIAIADHGESTDRAAAAQHRTDHE